VGDYQLLTLSCENFAAFFTPPFDYVAASYSFKARPEAVLVLALALTGLIGTFHFYSF